MIKNRVIKSHVKWSKKRTSIVLAGIGYVMVFVMLCFTGTTAAYTLMRHFLDPSPPAIIQEEPKLTRTCYFMHILFVGSDKNGKEIEVIQTPMECPSEYKPRRD